MTAPAPIYRSQGNQLFRTDKLDSTFKRGQTVPYDVNGVPVPAATAGSLMIDVNDLPVADSSKPLFEFIAPAGGLTFSGTGNHIVAGSGATGTPALRIFKNGSANGTIAFSGTTGTASFSDSSYAEGDLFSLYPPTTADATLDRVRITLGTD